MIKKLGSLLFFGGLVSMIYTGVNYINQLESFGFLGVDLLITKGDPMPVYVSAGVMILGIIIRAVTSRKR